MLLFVINNYEKYSNKNTELSGKKRKRENTKNTTGKHITTKKQVNNELEAN
jgi:hypothetical protein